jgi:hypothetical protein
MMKNFLIGFLFLTVNFCFSQDFMFVKGKKYKATPEWNLVCDTYSFDSNLRLQIAKTDYGAIVKIATTVSDVNFYLGERIFILLQNNSLIYCTDKGLREVNGNLVTSYFFVTAIEFKKLLAQNITDIRFKIIGKQSNFSSQTGMFTASNVLTVFDAYSKEKKIIDTKSAIRNIIK